MNNSNPYSPPAPMAVVELAQPKICINYFLIAEEGFLCTVRSRAQVTETLRNELIKYCTELGFQVVENGAECVLTGELFRVEQGSRILRGLMPGVLGAVKVQGVCQLRQGDEFLQEFQLRRRKAMGFQGGSSQGLLELSLRQIAMQVGSDIGVATKLIAADESAKVTRYLRNLAAVAGLASAALAGLAYAWAIRLPVRHDGLENNEKLWWGCVVAVFLFALLILLGLATAPKEVLASRQLLSLRSASGVKTITAQRIVIALLCAAPIGLLAVTYMCL